MRETFYPRYVTAPSAWFSVRTGCRESHVDYSAWHGGTHQTNVDYLECHITRRLRY